MQDAVPPCMAKTLLRRRWWEWIATRQRPFARQDVEAAFGRSATCSLVPLLRQLAQEGHLVRHGNGDAAARPSWVYRYHVPAWACDECRAGWGRRPG